MSWIWLDEPAACEARRVGVKAARLALARQAGHRVPDGFVVTDEALAAASDAALGVTSDDALAPSGVGDAARLASALARLGVDRVVVRSSAVGEDLAEGSFAGVYHSETDVPLADVWSAVERCRASRDTEAARCARARHGAGDGLSVLVQPMLRGRARGVAFSADPRDGARDVVLIAAHAPGESWELQPESWVVRGEAIVTGARGLLDEREALTIAALCRRLEETFGGPQDVEWVLDADGLWVVQSRPIVGAPSPTQWQAPAPGGYLRNFRLGDWLASPLTPSMESWLLPALTRGASDFRRFAVGLPLPDPAYVVVHGWYYASVNYLPATRMGIAQMLGALAAHAVAHPRRASVMFVGGVARLAEPVYLEHWRQRSWPAYREVVRRTEHAVEEADARALIAIVDDVAAAAGAHHGAISGVIGLAWKAELLLAEFHERYVATRVPGSHQELLIGLAPPAGVEAHAVTDLEWSTPLVSHEAVQGRGYASLAARGEEARRQALGALVGDSRRRRRLEALLDDARRLVPLRSAAARELTLGWPVMRRALQRLGGALGLASDDVYYLTRDELSAASTGASLPGAATIDERRALRAARRRRAPPLWVGELPAGLARARGMAEALRARGTGAPTLVRGEPASPGAARGPVHVVRDERDFADFPAGAVLVAPTFAPGWLPLLERAAAVISDTGSVLTHSASLAREYGVPCVVGTGDASRRLPRGLPVMVDGGAGTISLAI